MGRPMEKLYSPHYLRKTILAFLISVLLKSQFLPFQEDVEATQVERPFVLFGRISVDVTRETGKARAFCSPLNIHSAL